MKLHRLFLLSCLTAGLVWLTPSYFGKTAAPQIAGGIDQGMKIVRLALPELTSRTGDDKAAKLTALFNQVLWDDLDYAGGISLVSRSFYPKGRFAQPQDVKVTDWTNPTVKADYIAFGNTQTGSGRFAIEAHLWDLSVAMNRDSLPIAIGSVDTEEGARLVAHKLADQIVNSLFGGNVGIAESKIAFASDRTTDGSKNVIKEIWIMDYDGANQIQETNNKSIAIFPRYSPDGEKIAFTSYRNNAANIEIINSLERRALPFPAVGGTTTTPAWSPDGSRIAFATSKDGNDGPEIYVADWNGRNMQRLTVSKGSDSGPTWNPKTGNEIAFVSDRSGSPQIYTMDANGGNVQRITTSGGDAVNPSWSPDGQYIAFAWQRDRGSNYDIYIHNILSGSNSQLTSNTGKNDHPSWAPDGRHLVFESNRNGKTQIYTMLANGEKVRALTKIGNNSGPTWSGFTAK